MKKITEVLKANNMEDCRIKLSKSAQIELRTCELFSYFVNDTKLDFDSSIVRNANISDTGKLNIINAKANIRTKRSEMKKMKKATGILFDKTTAEEQMFQESTKAEQAVLDGYIMQTLREKAYTLYGLSIDALEMDGENPVSVRFVVKSYQVTKSGTSKPKTYGIAIVSRNYVQLSDFIPTVDTKTEQLVSILNSLFYKWNATKKMTGTWKECANSIQDALKEFNNADFETICNWVDLEVQKENN